MIKVERAFFWIPVSGHLGSPDELITRRADPQRGRVHDMTLLSDIPMLQVLGYSAHEPDVLVPKAAVRALELADVQDAVPETYPPAPEEEEELPALAAIASAEAGHYLAPGLDSIVRAGPDLYLSKLGDYVYVAKGSDPLDVYGEDRLLRPGCAIRVRPKSSLVSMADAKGIPIEPAWPLDGYAIHTIVTEVPAGPKTNSPEFPGAGRIVAQVYRDMRGDVRVIWHGKAYLLPRESLAYIQLAHGPGAHYLIPLDRVKLFPREEESNA